MGDYPIKHAYCVPRSAVPVRETMCVRFRCWRSWLDADCRRLFLPNGLIAGTYESLLPVPQLLELDTPAQRRDILRSRDEMAVSPSRHIRRNDGDYSQQHGSVFCLSPCLDSKGLASPPQNSSCARSPARRASSPRPSDSFDAQ